MSIINENDEKNEFTEIPSLLAIKCIEEAGRIFTMS
jgi:hypothetical protein